MSKIDQTDLVRGIPMGLGHQLFSSVWRRWSKWSNDLCSMFVCLNSASNRSLWHPAVPFHWPGGRTVTSDCRSELSRALRRDRAVTQQTTLLRKYCQVDSTHRKRQNIFYHNNLPYICLSVRLPVCLSKVQIIMLPHVACLAVPRIIHSKTIDDSIWWNKVLEASNFQGQ